MTFDLKRIANAITQEHCRRKKLPVPDLGATDAELADAQRNLDVATALNIDCDEDGYRQQDREEQDARDARRTPPWER